ncbi:MAG: ABC transporter substrate-binding protein [Lachnospiraceae bacterium]|nr:ABC transporter substrate-binding protein [Lachnospiraceae bacterium]
MRKKKLWALIALVLLLAGCGKTAKAPEAPAEVVTETAPEAPAAAAETEAVAQTVAIESEAPAEEPATDYVFTDDLGREVTVKRHDRVVTLLGSFCDEWLLAGGSVVGTGSDSFASLELDPSVADVGEHSEPNLEVILSLEPDLVIASSSFDEQIALEEPLESAGAVVAYFDVKSFDDYLSSLKIFTDITGRADLYEQYGTAVEAQIAEAKKQIDGTQPTVLFLRATSSSVKVKGSKGTVGGEILADLDTVNIADSDSLLEDLSLEAIIADDPDYIFVTTMGSNTDAALAVVEEALVSNPAWQTLRAVQNGNYYILEKELYNSKPNARWGEAYQKLADILYPR